MEVVPGEACPGEGSSVDADSGVDDVVVAVSVGEDCEVCVEECLCAADGADGHPRVTSADHVSAEEWSGRREQ